jgi:fimbrial isopeptide formation D2 family protein
MVKYKERGFHNMFPKIVSNLSMSPASSSQLAYYLRRLQAESVTRVLSVVMALMLAGLQIASIIAPAEAANNCSPNDVVNCGIASTGHPQATMLAQYDAHPDIKALLNRYGIDRNDIANTTHGTLNSGNHAFISFGRVPHFADDVAVHVDGATFYHRPLYKWGDNITYDDIEGRRHGDNKFFAFLYNCGNLVLTDLTPTTPTPPPSPVAPPARPTPAPAPVPAPPKPVTPVAPPATPSPVAPTVIPPTPAPVAPGQPNIVESKAAAILNPDGTTKGDAATTAANAGDVIEYTLTTTNNGKGAAKDYIVTDDMSDVLEYADVLDSHGATVSNGIMTWPKTTLAINQSNIITLQMKVKSPIPTRPTSISDPNSFDLKLDNVYGNAIRVSLITPPAKEVEAATGQLPQTGPGTSSLIVFALLGGIVYFYFRNRQLVSEVAVLRGDHA